MSRYYFHVMDGQALIDADGTELPDLASVRAEAIQTAGDMMKERDDDFWKSGDWQMTITDDRGMTVCSLHFSAKVTRWQD